MVLPNKIYFLSDSTTCILKETITDKKTKEISGRYVYEDGFYFKNKELVLPLSQIEKLSENKLITTNA